MSVTCCWKHVRKQKEGSSKNKKKLTICSGKSAGTKVGCGKCPSGDETRAARAFDLRKNPKCFLLWQLIRLRLVAGTPEWVKDWITRILNANQYLLDLLTSAVSAFCLGWSIASDTFSSLFQTHIFKFISYLPNYFLNIHPTCRDKRQWGGKEPDWTTSGPSPSVWYFQ